ncbi:MAG: aldolase/citrate lyase family protein [Brachybacterium sp.]|nr:aldolase/citrate lyase family protein [Brachybacterium sp.]
MRSTLRAGGGAEPGSGALHGALLRLPAEDTVEMLAVAGLDFVLLDLEHGPADTGVVKHHLALAEVHGVPVLIRPGERDPHLIQRCLDLGAAGVVVPHVDDADEAAEVVRWTRYPPLGARGIATYTRAGRFGTRTAEEHAAAAEEQLLIVMLESPAAVDDAETILATPGIDGYLIGPGDLGFAIDRDPEENRSLPELTAAAHHAGEMCGSIRMDIVPSAEQGRVAADSGCRLVVHNLAAVLMRTFAELSREGRGPRG